MSTITPTPRPHRILFVSHEASRTGAPMFLLHFLRWLRRETDTVFEILLGKGGPLEAEFAKICPVHHRASFAGDAAALARFDLIYANTVCNGELLDKLAVGDIPVITHAHELDCGYDWLGPRRMGRVIRQTSHFVACAGIVGARLQQRFGVPADRLTVHHEMIDGGQTLQQAGAVDATTLRKEYNLPKDALIAVACGTVDLRKGPDLFLRLAQSVRQKIGRERPLCFLWAGALNAPDLWIHLQEDMRKLGLGTDVRFVGELANPHPLLALGDIYCLMSRDDPFPLAMLEAALLGRPVLCFDGSGGGREFCDLGGGIAVPYIDVEAMAVACSALLQDGVRRAELGRQAAELVRSRFTVETIAPALWQTVRGAIERPKESAVEKIRRDRTMAEIYAEWSPEHGASRNYLKAHLARAELRQQAHRLLRTGKAREAVHLLVKAVGADLATRDPTVICESLFEIGEDLAPIDAKQSTLLLQRAAQVARNANINLEMFRSRVPHTVAAAA